MLIGPNNNIIKSEIIGVVKGNCQLTGMPDLKLGLNDKAYYDTQGRTSKSKAIEFSDIKFHQCVRLGKFENERMITFIPPDGEFELMSYRLDVRVKPLFSIDLITENPSSTRVPNHRHSDQIFGQGQEQLQREEHSQQRRDIRSSP
jgi:AP-1 complex subunit mu